MINYIALGLVAVMGAGLGLGDDATQGADALGTSCNDVDITVKNEKSDQIKVTKIGYQIDGKGTLHTEALDNKEIGKNGGAKTWSSQNLQHAPEGSKLVFKVYFQNDKVGGWGAETSKSFDRLSASCTDGRSYSFTVD